MKGEPAPIISLGVRPVGVGENSWQDSFMLILVTSLLKACQVLFHIKFVPFSFKEERQEIVADRVDANRLQ
jgi:hypothetical protein